MDKDTLLELEIKEVFATLRTFLTLFVQALSVLAVANITVIGFAIANKTAGMFLLGALIDFFTLFIFIMMDVRMLSAVYYRATTLNKRLGKNNLEFFTDFFATYYRYSLPQELDNLTKIADAKTRTKKLHQLFLPSVKRFSNRYFMFIAAAVLQLCIIPVLINWFGWKMF